MPLLRPSHDDRPVGLDAVLEGGRLSPVYQPIVRLSDLSVTAHEGLIRVDVDPPMPPPALFDLARAQGRLGEVELAAARCVVQGFSFAPATDSCWST